MTAKMASSWKTLAAGLESEIPGSKVEFTCFPSGGAMVDVRRSDNRAFVLAYSPEHGYAVDEVHADDGFLNGYRFAYPDFNPAAEKLRELVANCHADARPAQTVSLKNFLREQEQSYLNKVMQQCEGDKEKAALLLGVSLATLYRKLSGEEGKE